MSEVKEGTRRKLLVVMIIVSLFLSSQVQLTSAGSTYSKTWTRYNSSQLKITVSPSSANLEVEREYVYTVTLEAIAFGVVQDGFYSLAVQLRFLNSKNTIKTDLKYNIGELKTAGSKKQVQIRLFVPSAGEFSLATGESIQGQLQYVIYYLEFPFDGNKNEMPPYDMSFYTEQKLGWETVTEGTITNPVLSSRLTVILVAVIVVLIGSASTVYVVRKRRSQ